MDLANLKRIVDLVGHAEDLVSRSEVYYRAYCDEELPYSTPNQPHEWIMKNQLSLLTEMTKRITRLQEEYLCLLNKIDLD